MAKQEIRRPEIATAILVVGAIVYAALCSPAIGRRGYPPIDPFWLGVTYLWFLPVVVSALFDAPKFGSRKTQLVIYALVTAFFNAGTMGGVVPRNMNPSGMLIGTVIYGPFHMLIVFALEYLVQWMYSLVRTLADSSPTEPIRSFSLFTFLSLITWLCVAIGIPLGYGSFVKSSQNSNAIERANEDWKSNAVIYRDYELVPHRNAIIAYHVDPETGLFIEHMRPDLGFRESYNRRIQYLIENNGLPPYSLKNVLPTLDAISDAYNSTTLTPVTKFPFQASPSITIRFDTALHIDTDDAKMTIDWGNLPIHVHRDGELLYIRYGTKWMGVFHRDGRQIASASD